MAIVYPLTPPTAVAPSLVRITPVNAVAQDFSPFSGAGTVYEHPGKWWELEVTLGPMPRSAAADWLAFLTALNGPVGTFLLGDPLGVTPRGAWAASPLVKGAGQSGASLLIDGFPASTTGLVKAGDWFQLGAGASARLHQVLQDAGSNALGEVTLDIWPPLRASPADNATLIVSGAVGLWRLTQRGVPWSVEDVRVTGVSFTAREPL